MAETDRLNQIMSRMSNLSDEVVDRKLMAMLYGKPGAGKTVAAVGLAHFICPEGKTILYVDTKEGFVSLENHDGMTDNVERFQYREFRDLAIIATAILKKSKTKTLDFGTVGVVVIDEFSTATEMLLNELYRANVGAGPDEIPTDEVDVKLYKPLQDASRVALEKFQEVPGLHVILVAHETETAVGKIKVVRPGFTPKNYTGLSKLQHLISHLTTEITGESAETTKYVRKIQNHPSKLVDAKSRIGGLPVVTTPNVWVESIGAWLDNSSIPEAEAGGLIEDEPIVEGGEVFGDADDEPAFVSEEG